jgi:hypothetical protein
MNKDQALVPMAISNAGNGNGNGAAVGKPVDNHGDGSSAAIKNSPTP